MVFKGSVRLGRFLPTVERRVYQFQENTHIENQWDDLIWDSAQYPPEIVPIHGSEPDPRSPWDHVTEPISNEIKDLDHNDHSVSLHASPERERGMKKTSQSSQSNEIKGFLESPTEGGGIEISTLGEKPNPSDDEPSQSFQEGEFSNFVLRPASIWQEMINTIQWAQGCETDISFPCPFFRRHYCNAHALHVGSQWSFGCDYACNDFISALAKINPAFADLARRYGTPRNESSRCPDMPETEHTPEGLVQLCREHLIPLRLDPDGTLVVGARVPPELAAALEANAEGVAEIVNAQRARLATADEYVDPEFPCDHTTPGSFGEPIPWCDTGVHDDKEILARWQAIKDENQERSF